MKANRKLLTLDGAVLGANFEAQIVKRQQLNDDINKDYTDLAKLTIVAPADGIATGVALKQGAMAQDGMLVCSIQSQASFKLVVAVDELDVPKIAIGQKAIIKIDALPEANATAEVLKIALVGDKVNDVTTYNVTLKVTAPAGALAGMSSSTDIEVAFKAAALLVPVEAIQTIGGKTYVFGTLQGDGQTANTSQTGFAGFSRSQRQGAQPQAQRPQLTVKVGLINNTYAEILEGLNEGDKFAVPVAKSTANSIFGMGGSRPGQ